MDLFHLFYTGLRSLQWCYPDKDTLIVCTSPYGIQISEAFLGHTVVCANSTRNTDCEIKVLSWLGSKCDGFSSCAVEWEAVRCHKITCNNKEYDVNYVYYKYQCPSKHFIFILN